MASLANEEAGTTSGNSSTFSDKVGDRSESGNNAAADLYDVLVIGGGIVGLSILRAVTLAGYKAVLVEKEPDLLTWASGSNSGTSYLEGDGHCTERQFV